MDKKIQLPIKEKLTKARMMIAESKSRVFIETYGCQMNVSDSEVVTAILQQQGYELAHNLLQADVVLINTNFLRG